MYPLPPLGVNPIHYICCEMFLCDGSFHVPELDMHGRSFRGPAVGLAGGGGFLLHFLVCVGQSHCPPFGAWMDFTLALGITGFPAASLPACVPFWNAEGQPHAHQWRDDAGHVSWFFLLQAIHNGQENKRVNRFRWVGWRIHDGCLCLCTSVSIMPNQLSLFANLGIWLTIPPARYIYPTLCGHLMEHTTGRRMHWSWWCTVVETRVCGTWKTITLTYEISDRIRPG